MNNQKSEKKCKSISAKLDEDLYWEFNHFTKAEGVSFQDKLEQLVKDYVTDKLVNESMATNEEPEEKPEEPSEKQMAFLETLCRQTGQKVPQKKLTKAEAIRLIADLLSVRNEMYRRVN